MKSTIFKCITAISGVLLIFAACSNSTSVNETPPTIPSQQSMSIDMSEMNNAQKVAAKSKAGSNFNAAIYRAGVAKLILDANLLVPKVLVGAAQERDPEEVADGEYQWSYSTSNQQNDYSVLLTANVDSNDEVNWNFFVTTSSTDPVLNNFLFFSGEAEYNGTEGVWYYYDPNEEGPVSTVNWDIDEDGSVVVGLEVLSDRNGNLGNTIDYNFDGDTKVLEYYEASSEARTTISYDINTMTGFIISPSYNNGAKSCWDANLEDIACSSS